MLQKYGYKMGELVNDPRARALFVLSTLVVAALAGGAPSDHGG